ncbi:DUF4419 domain-containing protein [Actinoplanes sp. L3-i22]|uniref:DUF4419 domain-containing protein n=1 Tax=Actinoplanes sp. L3-i22 TaxID=2836373 RepID=UPI001C78BB63|nr:DUF4419 domain-containing protein [Actinoplanes sp. L3-i22]BCY13618.1 hypothetical protein L3i22_087060 [Actinoplanes sp. L3-i22]
MISFPADAVTPAADPLPTRPLGRLHPDALWTAGDPDLPVLPPDGVHPLLGAVARAFTDHRPLTLSPDAVWLTVLQGVARHIRVHADELRDRLVGHQGRELLTVRVPGAPVWPEVVAAFEQLLPAAFGDVFALDFSTSSAVDRMAGRVVLMDAWSPYFAYRVETLCGIPSVTLTGTAADWRVIRARVDHLAAMDLGLEKWCRSLAPIADQFVRAAEGDADREFWQRILKLRRASGGNTAPGWIGRFYPYLGDEDHPNPLLDRPIDDMTEPGIVTDAAAATLSRVKVLYENLVTGEQTLLALNAGVLAVAQDADGSLRPVVGCYLTRGGPELDDVLDRLEREGRMDGPAEHLPWVGAPVLVALYGRFGSGVLLDGAWRLQPFGDITELEGDWWIAPIFDLGDGRFVSVVARFGSDRNYWTIASWSGPELVDGPAGLRVYGQSLAGLLDGALDAGGDITQLDSGSLSQYLAM